MQSSRKNSQRRNRGANARNQTRSSIPRTLSDGPAYAGQQKVVLTLPGITTVLSTTVTTGVLASVTNLSTATIGGFADRFGSTFDEYRILGANVKIRPVTASTGLSKFWFDEKSSAAPTSLESFERTALYLPNTNANSASFKTMSWRARDLVDLEYSPIGTVAVPAYFKVYTDAQYHGAPIAVTALWVMEIDYIVEFRGIKST